MTAPAALVPLERALVEHHAGRADGPLRLLFDHGETLDLPPAWFFRSGAGLDPIDRAAVERASGRILDVGAGAGAHALELRARGRPVTALEVLPGAVRVLRERGVEDVRLEDVLDHRPARPYDTVLLLMNGTGVAGTMAGLERLLERIRDLLAPGGEVLVDSTDPGSGDPGDGRAPGELQIQLEYRGRRGPPFPHLYAAPAVLAAVARGVGLVPEVALRAEDDRYLLSCRRPVGP